MPNTKPIGVAYEDQLLDGARFTPEVSALTTQLTTITFTSPGGNADYAIQDLTDSSPFGFVTKDEGNSVLAVVANLQTRVEELETALQTYGMLP